jgi:hypothetical protein
MRYAPTVRAVSRTMWAIPLNPEERTKYDAALRPRVTESCALYLSASIRRNSRVIALIWARYVATS